MKCFYHHEEDAVGTCKSCGKGLCPTCAADLGKGLACRSRCEVEVSRLIAAIDENLRMSAKTTGILRGNRQVAMGAAVLNSALGALFLACGLLGNQEPLNFLSIMGGLFLAYGMYSLSRLRRMPGVEAKPARLSAEIADAEMVADQEH